MGLYVYFPPLSTTIVKFYRILDKKMAHPMRSGPKATQTKLSSLYSAEAVSRSNPAVPTRAITLRNTTIHSKTIIPTAATHLATDMIRIPCYPRVAI